MELDKVKLRLKSLGYEVVEGSSSFDPEVLKKESYKRVTDEMADVMRRFEERRMAYEK